jgi:spermidine synthase
MAPIVRLGLSGFRLIWLCFFLSGATGLVYQVVWLRMLGLVFGHTVYAITTVLAAFMAGLALGSFLFARLAPRIGNLVAAYGWLEIGIGLYCPALPLLLGAAAWGYLGLHTKLGLSYDAFSLLQFGLIFLLLLLPTTLMGGTLPVLSQALVRRQLDVGRTVGALYSVNTAGAVVGVVLAGYFLLPAVGNRATLFAAAAANLAVGGLALALARGRSAPAAAGPASAPVAEGVRPAGFSASLTVVALGVSGGLSMVYEVGWTRALALVIGSSTYAFTAMLVAVLLGIAGGSALYSWLWGPRQASAGTFAALQAGIGLATALIIAVFPRLPEVFLAGVAWSASPSAVQLVQLLVSACALLPATLLIGATFPCAVAVVARDLSRVGEHVGYIYAANTVGAIAGAVAGGFLIVPALGVHGSLAAGAAGNLVVAAVLVLASPGVSRLLRPALALAAGLAAVGALRLPVWDQGVMSSGPAVYARDYLFRAGAQGLSAVLRSQPVVFYRDGASSTVAVQRVGDSTYLRVNGKVDASTTADMPTQLMSGHLPLLLHPAPKSVLVIGLGSGVTAGAVARHPVSRIDIVELEPAVVEASRFFSHVNGDVLKDSRVTVVIADGRNFLLTTPERYDVIISEPSNPWIAGLASLFSVEFFELARSRLKPGGLMLQWLQAYSLRTDDLQMVLRTFHTVFPVVSVWNPIFADLLLLGASGPVVIDPGVLSQRFAAYAGLEADLRRIGLQHGAAVTGYLALSEQDAADFAKGAGLNTDDRLPLEFSAPRALYLDTEGPNLAAITAARRTTPPAALEQALDRVGAAPARYAIGRLALLRRDDAEARRQFERALALDPAHVPSIVELANVAYRSGQWVLALRLAREALSRDETIARAHYLAGLASGRLFQPAEARRFLQRATALEPENAEYARALAGVPRLRDGR